MTQNEKMVTELEEFSKKLRVKILDMALSAGSSSSHFGGALSIVEIVSVLFNYKMNLKKKDDNQWQHRDRFILSKGHACLAYYAALNLKGFISDQQLKSFEKDDSDLAGHPVKNLDLGIDFSNGSLGMGLSLGIGLSIASKLRKIKNKIYVILGDGECNEGSIWEAALSAPKFNLDNLSVIIDRNNFQQTGSNKQILDLGNLNEKWKSFGWETQELNGHSLNEIKNYFDEQKDNHKPKMLIANTIKGKGFSFSENNNDWHHSIMTNKIYEEALKEIES